MFFVLIIGVVCVNSIVVGIVFCLCVVGWMVVISDLCDVDYLVDLLMLDGFVLFVVEVIV